MNARILAAALLLSVVGCKKEEAPAPAPKPAEPAAKPAEPAAAAKPAEPAAKPAEAAPAAAAPAADGAPSAADTQAAKDIFASRCTACHGPQGVGDGPAAAALNPKPRNFTDAAWQASVTDEHIEKIIVFGGAAVQKSPAMPPNPDLNAPDKQGVVKALRAYVRGLKK